jgi:hypothetical protein
MPEQVLATNFARQLPDQPRWLGPLIPQALHDSSDVPALDVPPRLPVPEPHRLTQLVDCRHIEPQGLQVDQVGLLARDQSGGWVLMWLAPGIRGVETHWCWAVAGSSVDYLSQFLITAVGASWAGRGPVGYLVRSWVEPSRMLAQRPEMSEEMLTRWVQSESTLLAKAVATSPHLPRHIWRTLANHRLAAVQATALANPAAHPDDLANVFAQRWQNVAFGPPMASNPALPHDILMEMVGDPQHPQHRWAIENPNCPEEYRVLARVLSHPHTHPAL